MADAAEKTGLNIDYFPTNFVVKDNLIYYVNYECNQYMDVCYTLQAEIPAVGRKGLWDSWKL